MRLNVDGTFHAIRPDGSRDYDAELRFAEALARMASRAQGQMRVLKLTPRQILADPRGLSRIARDVVACEMDLAEAEYRVFALACAAGAETDAAIETLHKQITRYESEAPRVSRAIREAVRPMLEQRKPPDEIKQRAAAINKLGILTNDEVTQVLRSEYTEWKSTTQSKTTQIGRPITSIHNHQNHLQ